MFQHFKFLLICTPLLAFACKSSKDVSLPTTNSYTKSELLLSEILEPIPNYREQIIHIKGRGRAIISESGNSERFNINFESDTTLSLLTIKNRLGIEGGAMLVDSDSILMYFKLDNLAQKVSIRDGRLSSLNELSSINLIDLLHFNVSKKVVVEAYEASDHFLLRLNTDGGVKIEKQSMLVKEVSQPLSSGLPYSKIIYENYGELNGYRLPRKITIFSSNNNSKIVFQIRELSLNQHSNKLTLEIPPDIIIERL
jgi:hypothetical protein